MCAGVRLSVFAPQLCNTQVSDHDEYADDAEFKKSRLVPYLSGWGHWKGGLGGGWSLRGVHPKKWTCLPGGSSKQNFWTARVKSIKLYNRNPLVEICRLIHVWVKSEGEGSGGCPSFLAPPSKSFLGHYHGILNTSSESSAQAQSIGTLFGLIGHGGVCEHVQKSETHALECRPWGESSQ